MARRHRVDVTPTRQRLIRPGDIRNYDADCMMTTLEALGIDFDTNKVTDEGATFRSTKDEYRAVHNTYPEIERRFDIIP